MMTFLDHVKAGFPALWVSTQEPSRTISEWGSDAQQAGYKAFCWDCQAGVREAGNGYKKEMPDHDGADETMTKVCLKCGQEKELGAFYTDKHRKFRVSRFCKLCTREFLRQWEKNNHARRLSTERATYRKRKENNPEIYREKARIWAKNHPEKVRKWVRRYAARLFSTCLDHYGHVCALCGSVENLSMDHIGGNNGDSPEDSTALWKWIIEHNFPKTFRTLCKPCNTKDRHQRDKEGKEAEIHAKC